MKCHFFLLQEYTYTSSVTKWWGTEVCFLIFGLLFKLFIFIYLWNCNSLHLETALHFCQPVYSLTRNICKQLRNQREKITAGFKERSLMNSLLLSIFKKNKSISVFLWIQFYLVQRWSSGVFELKIWSFSNISLVFIRLSNNLRTALYNYFVKAVTK